MEKVRVLLIDDDEDDFVMFRDLLEQVPHQKFHIDWSPSYAKGKTALIRGEHDVCFVDYRLGASTGLDLLRSAPPGGWSVPLILLTGYGEQEVDLEAMRLGAADYLVKDPFWSEKLKS